MPKIKKRSDQQKLLQSKASKCVSILIKPLRIFQFLAILLLFAFTVYMIIMDPMPISALACILLIVLSGVYVFVLAVELISHFAESALHIIPMTIFSFLGLIFFGVAGILFILNVYIQFVIQIVATTLCLVVALLFLIDITMVLAFWKRKCTVCKRCCNNSVAELLPHKVEELNVSECIRITRHDATTSLSDIRIPRELEDVAAPDHSYRKIEYPRRRQYVDCPTCVPSLCNLHVAEIQTEPKEMSVVESQTPRAIRTETPMQTLSKCEFCYQQIPLVSPIERARVSNAHCFQHTPQWGYPAIVQFVHGEGVGGVPCCPGCKCTTNTTKTQKQQSQQQRSRQLTQQHTEPLSPNRMKSNSNETMTSEATQQVASTKSGNDVTRVTQPITTVTTSYKTDQRKHTIPDIANKQTKLISEDVDQKLTKTKRPEVVGETILDHVANVEKRRDNTEESEKEKTIKENTMERGRGGGEEHYTRIYQEIIRATERRNMTDPEESTHMQMSGTLTTPSSSRTIPRALLHLKSNKVDPIKNVNVFNEEHVPERIASKTRLDHPAAQENERPARISSPTPAIEQLNEVCLLCKQQKTLTPTSDNSRCYTIFKDTKGKYFCKFCAPANSEKITRLIGTDIKKVRCTDCQLLLRDQVRTNIKRKSDTCPKCGRSQGHTSPSPT